MSDEKPWVVRSDGLWREANRGGRRPGGLFWFFIGFGWGMSSTLVVITLMRAS